jgi:hypothetical protein
MRATTTLVATALVAAAMVSAASPATAHPTRIAVTRIDGDTGSLHDAIADALDGDQRTIVSTGKLDRTIDKLGLGDELSDRDVRRLAAALDADAVIQGAFDSRGHRLRLTIFANGRKGKPFNIQVRGPRSERFRKLVRSTMMAKLAAVVPADPDAAEDDDGRPARKPSAKRRRADAANGEADELPAGNQARVRVATADGPAASKRGRGADALDDSDQLPPRKPARGPLAGSAVSEASAHADGSAAARAELDDSDELPPRRPAVHRPGAVAEAAVRPSRPATVAAELDDSDELPPRRPPGTVVAGASLERVRSRPAGDARAAHPAGEQVAERDADNAEGAEVRFEPGGPGRLRSANLAAARAELGTSMTARSLKFRSTAFDNSPRPYRSAPIAGGRFEGELYPFALRDPDSRLAGIGVAGDFDQTIALTLHASAEPDVPLKATVRHYSVGLRYRLALGHRPTSPTLTFGGGYGARAFLVDRKALMSAGSLDLPDVNYRLFDPGLAFRLPIGRMVAITLGGRALLVTTAGAIQRTDQYGPASVLGGSASAGLELVFGSHVALRIAAEATQLDVSFAGSGALATSRDGDPSTIDVRGATDRYIGGAATLAVLY